MEKDITFTIQGWNTDNETRSIHDELKEYAKTLGWQEKVIDPNFIVDPENPNASISMIDNPNGYEQVIFYENPMASFWGWLQVNKTAQIYADAAATIQADLEVLKAQVIVTEQ